MSINQCTDQIVLALLPPARIASVTWLSRDPSGSIMATAARRVGVNHGLAEEVVAQQPDLIVSGTFTAPTLRAMLQRLHYPLIEVPEAASIADIRRITRQLAAAVGEQGRGEALISAMDTTLAELAAHPAPPLRLLAWNRDGPAGGPGTLYGDILRTAGARNLADAGAIAGNRPDMELLLTYNPSLIVQGNGAADGPSLGDNISRHRIVRRYWGDRIVSIPAAYHACGTPMIADAAVRLRGQIRAAAANGIKPSLPGMAP
jgi:iron complex transport system substrate-binding protein